MVSSQICRMIFWLGAKTILIEKRKQRVSDKNVQHRLKLFAVLTLVFQRKNKEVSSARTLLIELQLNNISVKVMLVFDK